MADPADTHQTVDTAIRITLTVVCDNETDAARITETLARPATAFGLEGHYAMLVVARDLEPDDEP